jgi:glycogen debranching enzyme
MTVFGRDTIITCLETMTLGPERGERALCALAGLQADSDDPAIEAEPGKIIHELRTGKTAAEWFPRYYGSLDSTPLFLVLLSEHRRWTGDDTLANELQGHALAALRWLDEYGDRDGDGFLEYEQRGRRGLENQSWKDSGDSQRFADGRLAAPPIAPCEVQGYAYDAKLRTAELSREVWGDEGLAERLEQEAAALAERFDEAFWLDERGGYYALALDGEKRPVDSLCSNIGHLLWSGIVPPERAGAVVERLLGDSLWTGWGIRTMSSADAGYNPIGYHLGTVWPHDVSLCAWGFARYGREEELGRLAEGLLAAAAALHHQLPEVFAGVGRNEAAFPIPYPTPCKPQAWAAAAPVLLLQLVLGLAPDAGEGTLVSTASSVPSWLGELELRGVPALGRSWDVLVHDGHVTVAEGQSRGA